MSQLKIHHLHEGGLSNVAIAKEVGCSVRTVFNVLRGRRPTAEEIAAGAMAREISPGRPSGVRAFESQITAWLSEKPDLAGSEIIRRLHDAGYRGSANPVYERVAELRPEPVPATPEVRFEGLPGEFAQFDFGQVRLRYRDGVAQKVRFFEGILKYSRHRHVEIVDDERAETLARATIACFERWGGAPKQWVYDNPTTVWADRLGRMPHDYLRQMLSELNSLIEPCTPRLANQKGAVENGVGYVKHGFFLARTFDNPEHMRTELAAWLRYTNDERPCAATGVVPTARLSEERERLSQRSLPWTADSFPLRMSSTVLPTGLVRFNGACYSVDPRRIGAPATLLVRRSLIDIEVGGTRCQHPRLDHTGDVSRLPEHSLAQVAVTTEQRKRTYTMRQHLFDLGPTSVSFCDRLISAAPGNTWYPDIHRLYDIAIRIGTTQFLTIIAECLARSECSVRAVASRASASGVA